MQDVVEIGTARVAKIPGINICAKTGTAENYRIIEGKRVKLKDNSMFVLFAPRENPKIAIAVVVENAGFGATWAGPIASLIMEKFLNDTLRTERLKEVDRIAAANLMPGFLKRLQFHEDSSRAAQWARQTGDSTRWLRYLSPSYRTIMLDTTGKQSNKPVPEIKTTPMIKPKDSTKIQRADSVRK
jgi:penicillin-binding protein 2